MAEVTLHQFHFSHFNEKVRWALDYKGIAHERVSYLPGPHAISITKLSGQPQVPVLEFAGGEVLSGSAHIIDELERRYPEPPLYPADPAEREAALSLQAQFDADYGPRIRRAFFSMMLNEGSYLCSMFASDRPWLVRLLYRSSFPLVRSRMRAGMGITDQASIDDAFAATRAAFDLVAARSAATGYLAGSGFTVADLTAASLLAPAANPDHPEMARQAPWPKPVDEWLEMWRDHPGAAWVREIYRKHRPLVATASGKEKAAA